MTSSIKMPFTGNLVGMRFRPPAEEVVALLWADQELTLQRQPENPHDENAIQVFVARSALAKEDYTRLIELCVEKDLDPDLALPENIFLGYIAAKQAVYIAPELDKEGSSYTAKYLPGDDGKPTVEIEITVNGPSE